ncbi:MAG: YgjP-like metallopeptidase domain-containing protein [Erysipelotrichaceae bacterium]
MRPAKPHLSQLKIGDDEYRVSILRMARRTLSMHVAQGELLVKAPLNADIKTILDWVITKQSWIEKRTALIRKMKLDEDEVWYLGKRTKVINAKQTLINSDGIYLKSGASLDAALRNQAIDILTPLFNKAANELGYGPQELKFRTMTRSWGRCTSKGIITLNTRLIACDPRFIRYVCIHELIHLKHLNHSPSFWSDVRRYVPDLSSVKRLSILITKEDRFAL